MTHKKARAQATLEQLNVGLGAVIGAYRRRAKRIQTEFALTLGLDQSALSRCESGRQQFTAAQLLVACLELKLDASRVAQIVPRYLAMKPMLERGAKVIEAERNWRRGLQLSKKNPRCGRLAAPINQVPPGGRHLGTGKNGRGEVAAAPKKQRSTNSRRAK